MPAGSWVRARERAERRRATHSRAECGMRTRQSKALRSRSTRRAHARTCAASHRACVSIGWARRDVDEAIASASALRKRRTQRLASSRPVPFMRSRKTFGERRQAIGACRRMSAANWKSEWRTPRFVRGVRAPIRATQCRRRRLLRGGACTPPLRTYDGPTNARGIRAHPPARLTAQATHSFNTGVSSDGARSASSNVRLLHVASSPLRPLSSGQRSKISATQSTNTRTFGDRCRLCG
ncbi:hypothetical protein BTRA_4781 [Burkholderia thailandensis USAMRU Malaysia |nr:hypothetical protein BTJ_4046 [Burkholderia thailandensis E444]AIC90545.1 hypothetical protein BTRA_4781 [Burkholderia thailandensis USAMRU Malaysia \